MFRLYYWYAGAPEARPGGPWWYKEFSTEQDARAYLETMLFALHAYAITDGSEGLFPPMEICPPMSAKVHFLT